MNNNENYLRLLSKKYPTIDAVSTEIINLQAILSLPKGTEHFLTDLHGEYEAFTHVLRNASGVIKRKIDEAFGDTVSETEKRNIATLVYYPKERLAFSLNNNPSPDYLRKRIYQLIVLCRVTAFKYTRSKVRKALPQSFRYVIEELLHEKENMASKQDYYNQIIQSIIDVDQGQAFIIALCQVIRELVVDRLHIVGDIYDRGPGAHIILDELMDHHSVDVQWGNHDIIWMGAACGSKACMANALRISLRYNNLETLEEGYSINLLPLAAFALNTYKDKVHKNFYPKAASPMTSEYDETIVSKMHKAIAVIQFKLEGQLIDRQPDFKMADRKLLHLMADDHQTITIGGQTYPLLDQDFPTIQADAPYELTEDEQVVVDKLMRSFKAAEKLQLHTKFLFKKGSIYLNYNGNLLLHAGVPLRDDLSLQTFKYEGSYYKGKDLFDFFDRIIRQKDKGAYSQDALDFMWYLWNGPLSPLFAKSKMATFERYFIEDKSLHKEVTNPYFKERDNEDLLDKILLEFGLQPGFGSIISGHVPVKTLKGEEPVKGNEKMFVIDGGFSKAYHQTTGIAGYTLTFNSRGMILVAHEPFDSLQAAIEDQKDSIPTAVYTKKSPHRIFVRDTDEGKRIQGDILILKDLLSAYRHNIIKERD